MKFYLHTPTDEDGKFLRQAEGGLYRDEGVKKEYSLKYRDEARMTFGVVLTVELIGGRWVEVTHKMRPFDYTGKTLIGARAFAEKMKAEVARVNKLKGHGIFKGTPGGQMRGGDVFEPKKYPRGGRYEAAFPLDWEQRMKEVVNKDYISIADMIQHIYSEAKRIFAVSDHDNAASTCSLHHSHALTVPLALEYTVP